MMYYMAKFHPEPAVFSAKKQIFYELHALLHDIFPPIFTVPGILPKKSLNRKNQVAVCLKIGTISA